MDVGEVGDGSGDGSASRRQRRRAVRPAGPVGASATPVLEKSPDTVAVHEPTTQQSVTPESTTDDSTAGVPEARPASAHRSRRAIVLTAVFVVLVLASIAAGVYLLLGIRSADADVERGEQFVQTARQTVLNLTTIHPDSAQADVDRLLAGASGDFKAEFEGREGPFVQVVQQARVDSNGEIIEAGIESSGDDFAEVLVAARAMVQNSDADRPEPRDFRLRVRVVDDGGVMTAARVEFVP